MMKKNISTKKRIDSETKGFVFHKNTLSKEESERLQIESEIQILNNLKKQVENICAKCEVKE